MWLTRGSIRRTVFGCGLAGVVACGGVVNTEENRFDSGRGDGGSSSAIFGSGGKSPTGSTCGNGRIEPGEICDGTNLGGATCASATMGIRQGGPLGCNNTCTAFVTIQCQIGDPLGIAGAGGRPGAGGAFGRGGTTSTDASVDGSAGATYGDPHLFTADGVEYDFQAVGEFVLLEDRDDPSFVVQVRQEPFRPFTTLSANTAVAALVGSDRVAIHAGDPPSLTVEGIPRRIEGTLDLTQGGRVVLDKNVYTLIWPTGERLVVNASFSALVNVSYVPGTRGKARRLHGLIGTPDGNPNNDFLTRQGEMLSRRPDGDRLYDVFGNSWRITPGESLFDYAPGEDTRAFTDSGFPHGSRAAAALPPKELKKAYLTCVLAGVTDVAALEACTADVAITGDPGFARAAAGNVHPRTLPR